MKHAIKKIRSVFVTCTSCASKSMGAVFGPKEAPLLKMFLKIKEICKSGMVHFFHFFTKPSSDYKIIGEALKEEGVISDEQLKSALKVQQDVLLKYGKAYHLGQIITELEYADEKDVIQAINNYYKLSVTSLSDNIKEMVGEKRGSFIDRLPTPRIPIWLQLFATTSVVVIVTILVLNYFILGLQKERLYQQTIKIGMVSLNYFAGNARIPLLKSDMLSLNSIIKDAPTEEALLYAIIVDQDKKIMAHTNLNRIGTNLARIEHMGEITQKGDITYFDYINRFGESILNLSRPVIFKGKELGEAHVGISVDFIDHLVKRERATIFKITLVILFFGILVAIFFGFRFSRPISNLVKATQEIGHGNYQYKLPSTRNDELGNLARAFNRMSDELWKQSLMQKSFGKYVGSEVLQMIMDKPEDTWLKGHKNEATILFADVRGFTTYTDNREPEKVVEGLNAYFDLATQAIMKYGGYVDKFIGDAVLGVFGVPVYHNNHFERAVRAAVTLTNRLQRYSGDEQHLLSAVAIGIDSGIVLSGNIGSQDKIEYTVIGDCVNVASRLNELARPGEVIISKTVYDRLADIITAEPLTPRLIKGKAKPVETFKVLDIKERDVTEN